jgi:multiple sugar transport system substrate-binding protein/sn-glycerol 3-phosphate transport system substrate-binding protein
MVRDMVFESMFSISQGADVPNILSKLNADANANLQAQLAVIPESPDPWADVDPSGQTIILWHQQPPAKQADFNDLIFKFNSTNKWGISVVAEYQEDIHNKFTQVINRPEAPDLVEIFQSQAADLQLSGVFSDMNPYVESIKWGLTRQDKADFFPGIYAQDIYPTFDNARLGFPLSRSMEIMYYNKEWLAELGYDAPPTTPAAFREMACAAAANPFSGATAEGSRGYELSINASHFASWTFAQGGDVFDYENSQYSYNNKGAVAAMTFLQELYNEGCINVVVERFGDQINFGQGTTLFTVGSSFGFPFYQLAVDEDAQFKWSVAPIPFSTEEPVINIYGASVSMHVGTPESELAAWLFLKYFTSPEVQAVWSQTSNQFPVRASVADALSKSGYFEANPTYETAFNLLQYGTSEPSVPGYDFVRGMVEEAMAAIIAGADVQSTLDQLTEDANINLAEQLQQ